MSTHAVARLAVVPGEATWTNDDSIGLFDAAGAGVVVFKRATDYDQYLAALEAHRVGQRFYDRQTGEFRRERLPGAERVRSETTITRSSSTPAKTGKRPIVGPRGWFDLDGCEMPRRGRDRSTPVVRMSLATRSELLKLAAETDYDGHETAGFLFGKPSYDSRAAGSIYITSVIRAAKNRARGSVNLDDAELKRHLAGSASVRLVGDWHTHVDPEWSETERSYEDGRAWLMNYDSYRANEDPRAI